MNSDADFPPDGDDDPYIPDDPGHDQHDARFRDLERLLYLVRWYLPDTSAPVTDAFPRMSPADRAEAREIMDRLADLTEDPAATEARQGTLLELADLETALLDAAARGQPLVRGGKIVRDPQTGEPVRDPAAGRKVRQVLASLERARERIAGPPPSADGNPGAPAAP